MGHHNPSTSICSLPIHIQVILTLVTHACCVDGNSFGHTLLRGVSLLSVSRVMQSVHRAGWILHVGFYIAKHTRPSQISLEYRIAKMPRKVQEILAA